MINTVVAEYEHFDDAFAFKDFYIKDEREIEKTMKKIFQALEAEIGEERAVAAFKAAIQ